MTADTSRRKFVGHLAALLLATPGLVAAQAPDRVRRVALLLATNPAASSHLVKALTAGLADLGWVEGRNLHLDIGYGQSEATRIRSIAADMLGHRPDALVVGNDQVAKVAAALTQTVPIVFTIGFDPVGTGLVQSLARPGGNVTGLSVLLFELMPKRLQLLKEAVPGLTRVALLYRAGDANAERMLKSLAEPARGLGIMIVPGEIRDADGFEKAFEQFARQNARGLLQVPNACFFQHRARVIELAIKHGMAAGFQAIEYAKDGALFSYGADFAGIFRRSAKVVDRILKGANPANIPVEQANIYELVVNLKTARRLGIDLPRQFLLQATQTIE